MLKKLKTTFFVLLAICLLSCIGALIFLGPIAKYIVEKYDNDWTGREISIGKINFNPISGSFRILDFKLMESKNNEVFFGFKEFNCSLSINKLFSSDYEVSNIKLISPAIRIVQDGSRFNYDDLLLKLNSGSGISEKKEDKPTHWHLHSIDILDGSVIYQNKQIGNRINVQAFHLHTNDLAWNKQEINLQSGFNLSEGGVINSDIIFNKKDLLYKLNLKVEKFNLAVLYPYLKDLIQVKNFDGKLSSDLNLAGNFNTPNEVAASGKIRLDDIDLKDKSGTRLLSMSSLAISVDSVNVKQGLYDIQHVTLNQPYLLFELYEKGTNFSRLLNDTNPVADTTQTEYANIFLMIGDYLSEIAKNYVVTNYTTNNFQIKDAELVYHDYTLPQRFVFDLEHLILDATNIRSGKEKLNCSASSTLNRSGRMTANLSVSPQDLKDLDLSMEIKSLRVSDFNPYTIYYMAYPFQNGVIEYTAKYHVANHYLKGRNNLNVKTVQLADKVNTNPAIHLPFKLAIAMLKDNNGNVKLNVPVEGNLDDPKYKFGKVIWQVVKNILIKAATAPYKLLANAFGAKEEDMKEIPFDISHNELDQAQVKKLELVANVLQEKSDLKVELIQVINQDIFKTYLGENYAKRSFYASTHPGLIPDSIAISSIDSIHLNDSLFVEFVNAHGGGADPLSPLSEKCIHFAGEQVVNQQVLSSMEMRNKLVEDYLVNVKQIASNRFRVINTPDQKAANTQTLSKYLINYFIESEQGGQAATSKNP